MYGQCTAGSFLGIWKWGGGMDKCKCLGGVNTREAQIYMKKHFKTEQITFSLGGGVVSQLGNSLLPRGGIKI